MRTQARWFALLAGVSLIGWVGMPPPLVPSVSAQDMDDDDYGTDGDDYDQFDEGHNASSLFRDDLAPYGEWYRDDRYGEVWRPTRVRSDWRPYSDGHWVLTEYGWAWVPDEQWGWAPFHYGRWFLSPGYGWSWVPGRQWAPAWVSWRRSDEYVGWAPLSPDVRWRPGGYYREERVDPSWYFFVETRHFVEPRVREYVVVPSRNVTIVNVTKNVTNYTIINNRVANHSLNEAEIEKVVGRRIERQRIDELEQARPKLELRTRKMGKEKPSAPAERAKERSAAPPERVEERSTAPSERVKKGRPAADEGIPSAPPPAAERQENRRREEKPAESRRLAPAAESPQPEKALHRGREMRDKESQPAAPRESAPREIERKQHKQERSRNEAPPQVERRAPSEQPGAGKQSEEAKQRPERAGKKKKPHGEKSDPPGN